MQQAAMDASAFAEMKELMGDSLQDIIGLTLDSLPEQLKLLDQAVLEQDAEAIFNVAHRIKSSTSTIGALGLAKHAETIELQARSGDSNIADHLVASLKTAAADVICILQQELNN